MSNVLVFDAPGQPIVVDEEVHDVLVFDTTAVATVAGDVEGDFIIFDAQATTSPTVALAQDFIIVDVQPPPVAQLDTGETDFLVITSSGPAGPPGVSGDAFAYVQSVPAATWIIAHNLHRRPPVVVLLDGDTVASFPDVSYPDLDTVSIQFPSPCTGIAEM